MSDLNDFGAELMKSVRDEAILTWISILEGKMNGKTAVAAREAITRSSTPEEAVLAVIPDIVNTVLHRFLALIDGDERLKLTWLDTDLAESSDGLPGELASKEGWIARLSQSDKGVMGSGE